MNVDLFQLCQMSEKISRGQEAEEKGGFRSPQRGAPPVLAVARRPSKAMQLEDSSVDNLCSSPIVYSSKLRSWCDGDLHSATTGTKCSKVEWVEQYQTGVFITFTALPGGQRGLRRIRFRSISFLDIFELAFLFVIV